VQHYFRFELGGIQAVGLIGKWGNGQIGRWLGRKTPNSSIARKADK